MFPCYKNVYGILGSMAKLELKIRWEGTNVNMRAIYSLTTSLGRSLRGLMNK